MRNESIAGQTFKSALEMFVESISLKAVVATLALSAALTGLCFNAFSQNAVGSPTLDVTLAYLNSHTVSYEEGVPSGRISFAVSADGAKLAVLFKGSPQDVAVQETVVVHELVETVDVSSDWLEISCKGHAECVETPHVDKQGNLRKKKYLQLSRVIDDDQRKRIQNAFQHLFDLLNAQYKLKHEQDSDPFAPKS